MQRVEGKNNGVDRMKVLIMGLGNRLYGDDAFGSCLAEALSEEAREVRVMDGDSQGIGLAGWLEGYDLVIFIDATSEDVSDKIAVYKMGSINPQVLRILTMDAHRASPLQIYSIAKDCCFNGEAYLITFPAKRFCFPCTVREEAFEKVKDVVRLINRLLREKGLEERFDPERVARRFREICERSLFG